MLPTMTIKPVRKISRRNVCSYFANAPARGVRNSNYRFVSAMASRGYAMQRTGFYVLSVTLIILTTIPGCVRKSNNQGFKLHASSRSQLHSLSLNGRDFASIVVEKTPGDRELLITQDSGQSWKAIPKPGDTMLECATMLDDKTGWAVDHSGQIKYTNSGGATWTKAFQIDDFTGAESIEFLNEKEGWIKEFLSIWRTVDGGVTWHQTFGPLTAGVGEKSYGLFPISGDRAISLGAQGKVFFTESGGNIWKVEHPFPEKAFFADVWFESPSHGWLTGTANSHPLLLETKDFGESWAQISLPHDIDILPSSVCAIGERIWTAGDIRVGAEETFVLEGVLLYSEDGGKRWQRIPFAKDEPFFSTIRFSDEMSGWLVGRDSLYRSEDGGKNWKKVITLPPPKS